MKRGTRSLTCQALVALMAVMLCTLPGCKKKRPETRSRSQAQESEPRTEGGDEAAAIVARVGDLVVSRAEFEAEATRLAPGGQMTVVQRRNAERRALTTLTNRRLVELAAAQEHLEVSDEEVDAQIAAKVKAMGGDEAYLKYLADNGYGEEAYREVVHSNLLRAKLRQKFYPEVITEDQMKAFYKGFATNPGRGNKVKVARILLNVDAGAHESKWQEAEAQLEKVKAEIASGLPFDEAARKYSQGPYAKRGGDMGWATDKRRPTEVFGPALGLAVGEVHGPVRIKQGAQLITVTATKNDAAGDFEAERQNIKEVLEGQRDQRNDRRLYEKLRAQFRVEKFL
jgi:parvulin-like peptidyl-prolyl isomerase